MSLVSLIYITRKSTPTLEHRYLILRTTPIRNISVTCFCPYHLEIHPKHHRERKHLAHLPPHFFFRVVHLLLLHLLWVSWSNPSNVFPLPDRPHPWKTVRIVKVLLLPKKTKVRMRWRKSWCLMNDNNITLNYLFWTLFLLFQCV